MKYIFVLLLLPNIATAQYDYLLLEGKQVKFERKYTVDSATGSSIQSKLSAFVPTIKGVTDYYNGKEVITCKFKDAYIDYRKYGGKWGNTAPVLNWPFTANASIVWKDGAYKVTITNIVFHTKGLGDTSMEDVFTRKKVTVFSKDAGWVKNGKYVESYLGDLFLLANNKSDW